MSAVEVVTLGCRLNLAESETIRAALAGQTDLVVINSCAVTAEAAAASRKAVRRARRDRPDARIIVTGCASEIERDRFAAMAEVERIIPNAAKLDAVLYSSSQRKLGFREAGAPVRETPAFAGVTDRGASASSHARAFLPVQNGCDHRCTFCIIPYGRGPSRSVPAGAVVTAARAAVAAGRREIVLTGVDLTAYGAELPGRPTLGALVDRLLRLVPGIERLRLSSLDPCEVDARLFELIAHEPRVMPHVHLSLQAGDDMILKRMKRRHTRADAVALVARLKAARPDIAIGADLIAGFPTETDAMFANSLALLDDCDVVLPHIFPFSPREGTPAARMPQLPRDVVRARAAALREAAARRQRTWLEAHIGTVQRVLIERDGRSGHAEDFAKVLLRRPGEGRSLGAEKAIGVRIVGVEGDALVGEPA